MPNKVEKRGKESLKGQKIIEENLPFLFLKKGGNLYFPFLLGFCFAGTGFFG
jgi:hypothetical protein